MTKFEQGTPDKPKAEPAWWQPALALFLRMSAWIAAPVLLAALIGGWLDRRYQTEPWGLLATVGIAFVISIIGLVIEASREFRKYAQNEDNNAGKNIDRGS